MKKRIFTLLTALAALLSNPHEVKGKTPILEKANINENPYHGGGCCCTNCSSAVVEKGQPRMQDWL